jgi:hypothetical protein
VEHFLPPFQGFPEIPSLRAMDFDLKMSGVVVDYAAEHSRLFVIHLELNHGAPPFLSSIILYRQYNLEMRSCKRLFPTCPSFGQSDLPGPEYFVFEGSKNKGDEESGDCGITEYLSLFALSRLMDKRA